MSLNYIPTEADKAESGSFELIPKNTWVVGRFTEAALTATNAGTGKYLRCTFMISDGEQVGRKIFTNITTENPNPKAVSIGRQALLQITQALGLAAITHESQIIGLPMMAKIGIEDAKNGYDAKNKVVAYKVNTVAQPVVAPVTPAPPVQAQPEAFAAPVQQAVVANNPFG